MMLDFVLALWFAATGLASFAVICVAISLYTGDITIKEKRDA